MLSSEDDLPQTSNARPQTSSSRRTRPESARKSAKRQPQRTTHSEPDEDEDLDFVTKMIADKTGLQFAKDSIYSAARSVDPVPAAVSTTGKNTLWPQRTDSLQKGTSYGTARKAYDGTLADDEESNDNIFPEASKTKSLPGALDQEDEEDPDGLGNEPLGSIGAQLAELFTYIDAYQPQTFELSPELKCFIPEYMPSIGDIDPMIKVDLPTRWPGDPTTAVSEKLANLGSEVLDEPSIKQSDPAVLDLRLRALHKSSSTSQLNPTKIRAIQLGGQQDGIKALNQWIQNVHSLHAQKPQDRVEFSKKMPDVEVLMSQWAEGMEEALDQGEVQVPSAEIDMSLKEYCQLACNMVDIPIHLPHTRQKRTETRAHIESLYCLLNLYSEFKNSQHFSGRQQGLAATAEPAPAGRAAAI
ncbi:intraflagellar transport complex B protein 46 C terminal-domain-containing protein [Phlyctochytrium arcticum]|nr:intraflagellar transport complex B protein 46 C terminal-domain-containing protein [Phlyctochytrium arcticum]